MRSSCMLFEKHAGPLIMRLSLPLSSQRNVTQRKRVNLRMNSQKNPLSASSVCVDGKMPSPFAICLPLTQRKMNTVPLQNESKNLNTTAASMNGSSGCDWCVSRFF